MTMMVRDEIDVIAAVVEHHLAQGVDLLVVTDNGSVDGTAEILQRYADRGVVELHHDPVHRKQQGVRVTEMARRAYEVHGADWVINGDADEFVAPVDRSLTVRKALEQTPTSLGAFTADVVNLVGPPAARGAGFSRLVWRDERTDDELHAAGILAQPTPNAIHVGDADVVVAQGNHFVSIESKGRPDAAVALEVLHLPWRSFSQFEQKVLHAGRAYEASPDLRPSPNHHGMADYRRALEGRLAEALALRLPTVGQLERGGQFVHDSWLHDHLREVVARAVLPELVQEALDDSDDDVWPEAEHAARAEAGERFRVLERAVREAQESAGRQRRENNALRRRLKKARHERDAARRRAVVAEQQAAWVPLAQDIRRVGRRGAGAVVRRLRRG